MEAVFTQARDAEARVEEYLVDVGWESLEGRADNGPGQRQQPRGSGPCSGTVARTKSIWRHAAGGRRPLVASIREDGLNRCGSRRRRSHPSCLGACA